MKVNLTLFYSNKIYLTLRKDIELEEMDQFTTEYQDEETLRRCEPYKTEIERFNIAYQNYRNRIKSNKDRNGKLCLTYYDQNGDDRKLRILYQKDQEKLKPIKVINAIQRRLKQKKDNTFILALFREYDFIFGTEYNYHRYHLGNIKKALSYSDSPTSEEGLKKYNTLVKIVKNELLKGYDKSSKATTPSSYYHIRLIDEFFEKNGITTTVRHEVDIANENLSKIKQGTLVRESKRGDIETSFTTIDPDYAILDEIDTPYVISTEEEPIRWIK